jgi:hypothetical protein
MSKSWGAENWDKPDDTRVAGPPPVPRLSWSQKFFAALFLLTLLGGGLATYVALGRSSHLKGTLPLPRALRTTSAGHGELLLLGRALDELCVDAETWLRLPGPRNRVTSMRLHERLGRLHRVGRELEPQLTREEARVLMAFQNAARMVDEFLDLAADASGRIDGALVRTARTQIARGLQLARGESIDDLIMSGLQRALPSTSAPKSAIRRAGDTLRLTGD